MLDQYLYHQKTVGQTLTKIRKKLKMTNDVLNTYSETCDVDVSIQPAGTDMPLRHCFCCLFVRRADCIYDLLCPAEFYFD